MTVDKQTAHRAIEILNFIIENDPDAALALLETRFPCNEVVADHPSIQVQQKEDGTCEVGLLGILNGVAGSYGDEGGKFKGWGPVCVEYDENKPVKARETL